MERRISLEYSNTVSVLIFHPCVLTKHIKMPENIGVFAPFLIWLQGEIIILPSEV